MILNIDSKKSAILNLSPRLYLHT